MKAYLTLAICVYRDEHGRRMIKTEKLETKKTDSLWPLSCAALITTKRLFGINQYLEKSAALARGDWKAPSVKAD